MWHLIEDFFDQNILMKAFIGLGLVICPDYDF